MKRILILFGLTMSLLFTTGCAFGDFLNQKAGDINNIQLVKDLTKNALTVVEKYQNGTSLVAGDATILDDFIKKLNGELNDTSGTVYSIVRSQSSGYTELNTYLNTIETVVLEMKSKKADKQVSAISTEIDTIASGISSLKTKFKSVAGI